MQFKKLKLSAIALAVAGLPVLANAAFYDVVKIDGAVASGSAMATAISPDGDKVAVEELSGPVGLNYSEELSRMIDDEHVINSYNDLENYCENYLGYNTCDAWADEQWFGLKATGEVCESEDYDQDGQNCLGGLKKEIDAWYNGYTSNSVASLDGNPVNPFGVAGVVAPPTGTKDTDSTNVVINDITDDGKAIGTSSSPYYKNGAVNARAFVRRGFYGETELLPSATITTGVIPTIGQTNAFGSIDTSSGTTIVFGSSSVANMGESWNENKEPEDSDLPSNLETCSSSVNYSDRSCQYFQFANQASVWLPNAATNPTKARIIASFPNGATDGSLTAQATIRAAALVVSGAGDPDPVMVGFNTYDDHDFYARAVKYSPVNTVETPFDTCLTGANIKNCWSMDLIPGIEVRPDGDTTYSYTVANDINQNNIVVGVVKNSNKSSGSYAENVFVNEGTSTTVLGSSNSALFFKGYNATAAAINNNNELVGKVDIETARDRSRRQRGYIYLHGTAPNLATFNNTRGWLLDDLTNDNDTAGTNNQFRIAEAFDVSDNGTIAASAFYCASGYNSTAQNALCNDTEELVAVKLARGTGSILPRKDEIKTITRSGGGIGMIGIGLLVLVGLFRRRQ